MMFLEHCGGVCGAAGGDTCHAARAGGDANRATRGHRGGARAGGSREAEGGNFSIAILHEGCVSEHVRQQLRLRSTGGVLRLWVQEGVLHVRQLQEGHRE